MLKKIIILFLLIAATVATQAGEYSKYRYRLPFRRNEGFLIYSVNLTGGVYKPKLDYFNDIYLPSSGVDETFKSNIFYGGNLSFILNGEYRFRVGLSYWSNKVIGPDEGLNEFKVGFTRMSLGALYAPEFIYFANGIQLYVGFEGYGYQIKNTVNMKSGSGVVTSSDQNGHDLSFAPVIGIERVCGKSLVLGAEFSYMLGSYDQSENVVSQTQKVSINGPQVTLSVGYKF